MVFPTDAALALLEMNTYAVSPSGTVVDCGIDRAVISLLAGCIVVSIMGTRTPAQWISDFKVAGAVAADHPAFGPCESGFLAGAMALWPTLKSQVGALPLIIQGHSRGAGMVPILAALALLGGIKPARCVCWEAPRAVGPVCRQLLTGAGVDGVQYWHGDDPVPCIPAVPWLVPNVWPIVHFGEWRLDPFTCHFMEGIVADMTSEAVAA